MFERAIASKTKGTFVGKNTCLIHKTKGSFLLLGEWVSTLGFDIDRVESVDPESRTADGGCGTCKRCQVHCPTGALDEDYRLDARLCLSYWTIENRGTIPKKFWSGVSQYVYGCDICQNVCPYNRGQQDSVKRLDGMRAYSFPPLGKVVRMNQREYEGYFGGSPMTRAKKSGLSRNAMIAMYVRQFDGWESCLEFSLKSDDKVLRATAEMIKEDMDERSS
jgi:epoxyqueuosine reductase